jgi:hypothetical protein
MGNNIKLKNELILLRIFIDELSLNSERFSTLIKQRLDDNN